MPQRRLALVGVGKIARDQHLPALAADPHFELVATASPTPGVPGVPHFHDLAALLQGTPGVDAVSICTPPQSHYELALAALRAGCHVMLEKPPTATTRQIGLLAEEAQRCGRTLFQAWHSRFAAGVAAARLWLSTRQLLSARIVWKEDVQRWHPGQQWLWEPGGCGVFDPGINALSVLTEVLPFEVCIAQALLDFPENQHTPIAARLQLRGESGVLIAADFDFRQQGEQTWTIELTTAEGLARLLNGGDVFEVDGRSASPATAMAGEYPSLYRRFAELCDAGRSEVDARPFQLVADAFLVGERRTVAAHHV